MGIDQTELVKAGADALFAAVKDFFNRLAGPFADEVGGILGDRARVWRFKQAVRLLEKVKRLAEEAGFEPKAVPLKILLPILEDASLEEDEGLHDQWANLLANAANAKAATPVHPSYIEILRQFTPREARFLNAVYDRTESRVQELLSDAVQMERRHPVENIGTEPELFGLYCDTNGVEEKEDWGMEFAVALDNLRRLGILHGPEYGRSTLGITGMGVSFWLACRKPAPEDSAAE